jgi:alpha-L-rhamnosidase
MMWAGTGMSPVPATSLPPLSATGDTLAGPVREDSRTMTTSRRQAAGRTTYRRALAAGASVLAAALLMTPAAAGAAVRTGGPLPSWPASPDWQQYVEAPGSANLTPVRVVSVSGTVTNPGAVVAGGRGDTTLTRSAGDTGQTDIVLDYGRDIGGIPSFTVAAASGSPTMEAGYSEAAEFIAPGGDGGTPTIGANGDPSRADSYTVSGPGVITNRYIQGGERYQEISLTSAGSVSLSSVGIRYTAYDGTPAATGVTSCPVTPHSTRRGMPAPTRST